MNYVELNIQSLKYQSGCRDLCIRNFEFEQKLISFVGAPEGGAEPNSTSLIARKFSNIDEY